MTDIHESPLVTPFRDLSSVALTAYSLDAQMLAALPQLKEAVKQGWQHYRLDPQHAHINAMREEVKLLAYWLARYVAR